MFIDDDLWDRVAKGTIVDFSTYAGDVGLLDPDDRVAREVYLRSAIINDIESWPDRARDAILAELVQFLTGAIVMWGSPKDGNHIKPLDPVQKWVEFKVRQTPQTRLFGAFGRHDLFVGVRAQLREKVPKNCQELLANEWNELWGNDMYRHPVDDPNALMSNCRVLT